MSTYRIVPYLGPCVGDLWQIGANVCSMRELESDWHTVETTFQEIRRYLNILFPTGSMYVKPRTCVFLCYEGMASNCIIERGTPRVSTRGIHWKQLQYPVDMNDDDAKAMTGNNQSRTSNGKQFYGSTHDGWTFGTPRLNDIRRQERVREFVPVWRKPKVNIYRTGGYCEVVIRPAHRNVRTMAKFAYAHLQICTSNWCGFIYIFPQE